MNDKLETMKNEQRLREFCKEKGYLRQKNRYGYNILDECKEFIAYVDCMPSNNGLYYGFCAGCTSSEFFSEPHFHTFEEMLETVVNPWRIQRKRSK
jgi:hypothetical protein